MSRTNAKLQLRYRSLTSLIVPMTVSRIRLDWACDMLCVAATVLTRLALVMEDPEDFVVADAAAACINGTVGAPNPPPPLADTTNGAMWVGVDKPRAAAPALQSAVTNDMLA
jgi:hypothetical protein